MLLPPVKEMSLIWAVPLDKIKKTNADFPKGVQYKINHEVET